jgi:hypothetical protein
MAVIGWVVPMRMSRMPFVGSTVFVAVLFVDVCGRQGGMALDFGEDERGRIV